MRKTGNFQKTCLSNCSGTKVRTKKLVAKEIKKAAWNSSTRGIPEKNPKTTPQNIYIKSE